MNLEGKRNSAKNSLNIFKLKYFILIATYYIVIETNVENTDEQKENELAWKVTTQRGTVMMSGCFLLSFFLQMHKCKCAHIHPHTLDPDVCGDHTLPAFSGAGRGSSGSSALSPNTLWALAAPRGLQ